MPKSRPVLLGALVVSTLLMTACESNSNTSAEGDSGPITVDSSADACSVSSDEVPSGNVTFAVTNSGSEVTEFYLYASDGQRIVGEVENVGPGITRNLIVQADPGDYVTACKPGMVGEGIRAPFTVTDSGTSVEPTGSRAQQLDKATNNWAAFVRDQTAQLLVLTKAFAQDYAAGNDEATREQYAPARMFYERIEPVAEAFGDLDPKLDLREADVEQGQKWTGWHAIEKDLWPPNGFNGYTPAQRKALAAQLVADTEDLNKRVQDLTYKPSELGNGAKGLLDEVATSKVTGEEETFSHTDLWDFQANVEGARVAYEDLRPVVKEEDPALANTLDDRFNAIINELNKYRVDDTYNFKYYNELTHKQIQQLADAVDALSEPLSQLTTTVLQ